MREIFIGLGIWVLSSIPLSILVGKLLVRQSTPYVRPVTLKLAQPVRQEIPIAFDPVVITETSSLLHTKN